MGRSIAQHSAARLDPVFHSLADPTGRAVLERLTRGAAPVSELAAPFSISLPSFLQHLRQLEACGLIRTHKRGGVRTCEFRPQALQPAENWLEKQRSTWSRLDQLDDYLPQLKEQV